jgi:carbon-monoxide dehydrogenase small subunit
MKIEFTLNGEVMDVEVPPDLTLLDMIRDYLKLTGTKCGCNIGECGACSVILNGKLVKSCMIQAQRVNGCSIVTIEGVHAPDGGPNDLQQAFLRHGATQCGYCTPGMILAGEALLAKNQTPSQEDIKKAISGNLCRCTGYQQIIDAIAETAQQRLANHGNKIQQSSINSGGDR